jgi:hypothetical protein
VRVFVLQHLHEPFDVAEPAGPQLQVTRAIDALREALVLDAGLDPLDLPKILPAGRAG